MPLLGFCSHLFACAPSMMVREAGSDGRLGRRPAWRSPRERRAARQRAAASADRALQRLTWRCGQAGVELRDLEVSQRLLAVRPAFAALVHGRAVSHTDRLRRNVGMHARATGLNLAMASAAQLRKAQRGPRLGVAAGAGEHVVGVSQWANISLPVPAGALGFGPRWGPALVAAARASGFR